MTRSAPGAGSIQSRGEGSWRLVVSLAPDPITGRRRQLVRTVRGSKRQARDALNALLAERGSGRLNGSAITVCGLVAEWLDNETELSPTTMDDYRRVVRMWLQGPFGAKPASKVTVAEVRDFYRHLTEQGVSPWRVLRLHEVLRRAFNLGMRWEWLARNPVELASPPTPRPKKRPMPTDRDVIAILNAAGHDFATYLRVLTAAGARRGEICGLQWPDLDLDRGVAAIRRSVVYTAATGVQVKGTKTDKARVFALDETTCHMLAAHRLICIERARLVGKVLDDESFVFASVLDGSLPRRPDWATQYFVRLRDRLGINVQLKQLRHDSVTYLLNEGIAPNAVASRHGHARTSMTLDVYGHAVPASDRLAAELVGRRLDGLATS